VFLFSIILCFITGHIQNDFVTPAFLDMKNDFNVSPAIFHLISSSFSVGLCLGGLLLGAVADFFGYKKVLSWGLALLVIANLFNIAAYSIEVLIVSRFFQGIGCSAPIIICVAMIFEHCQKDQSRQLVGLNNGIITYAKSFAPIFGAFVNNIWGWEINFLILCILSAMAFLMNLRCLPCDKKVADKVSFSKILAGILQNYIFILRDKSMVLYIIVLGFIACSLITFTIGAPIIYMESLSVSKVNYGFHQSIIWFVFGSCCILNNFFTKIFQVAKVRNIAFLVLAGSLLMLNITYYSGINEARIYTVWMTLYAAGAGVLITIIFTDAMLLHKEMKGAKSSLIASCRALFVAIAAGAAGYFFNGTMLPLILIITSLGSIAMLFYYFLINRT
jgi:DHA1 family bicyclomycin/chloramphenicol resistance-like MFS transporter